jgi:hypothetical protein
MQFIYSGTEDAADPTGTQAFGLWFPIGEPVTVESEHAIRKLTGHPHFAPAKAGEDDEPAQAPKRRGRPAKVKSDAEIAD